MRRIDINNEKLATCNAGHQVPVCAKADLNTLVPGPGDRPIVEGTTGIDIFEHINKPATGPVPPARKRTVWGHTYDTADHRASAALWASSCAIARRFCFMRGPAFDNEDLLRAGAASRISGHCWRRFLRRHLDALHR